MSVVIYSAQLGIKNSDIFVRNLFTLFVSGTMEEAFGNEQKYPGH